MFFNFGCLTGYDYFPNKEKVLAHDFNKYENFFPIATLDLSHKGIQDKIQVMYVSFDPTIDHKKTFPASDNIDVFSFSITKENLLQPTFDKSALTISNEFKNYFVKQQSNYNAAKQAKNKSALILLTSEPDWWQNDETPMNSKNKPMTFICQVDIKEICNDDCRLFVFYDKEDRVVKYIYQRD